MYIDPITRQTFIYASAISCNNNPHKVKLLDPKSNKQNALNFKSVSRSTPILLGPKYAQSAVDPNSFSAKEA